MNKSKQKILTGTLEELIKLLGVGGGSVEFLEEGDLARLLVKTQTPAHLIGYHGKTLDALQIVLSAIFYQKSGERAGFVVDVDGWREKRQDKLALLAQNLADKVKTTGKEEAVYNLTPSERKVVHLALSEVPGITTESRGEGRDRYLVIKPEGEEKEG